ncbi:preprotein translocase subunit YajC [Nocardioides ultimimeridianus]
MQQLLSWLPILLIAVVFWLLIIRPAQRRQSATLTMQKTVDVGDDVVLTSGIFGTVVELTDDHVGVEVAEGVTLRVLRGAIGSKVHKDEADDQAEQADELDPADEADGDTIPGSDDVVVADRED